MGLPLRTLCLLIPTRPHLWPHFTPLLCPTCSCPPPSARRPLWPLIKVQHPSLYLCSSFVCPSMLSKELEDRGSDAEVNGDSIRARVSFLLEFAGEGMNPSAVLISSSIFKLILKPTGCAVCVQASVCVHVNVFTVQMLGRETASGICVQTPPQTIDMSVWMTWWAWNWLQLLCRNTHTHPQLRLPHTDCVTNKRLKTSQHNMANVCRLTIHTVSVVSIDTKLITLVKASKLFYEEVKMYLRCILTRCPILFLSYRVKYWAFPSCTVTSNLTCFTCTLHGWRQNKVTLVHLMLYICICMCVCNQDVIFINLGFVYMDLADCNIILLKTKHLFWGCVIHFSSIVSIL